MAGDLAALLDQLPRRISVKFLHRGLRKGANVLARRARRRAPKLTGKLRRGIRVRVGRAQQRGLGGAATVQVYVSRGVFYAAFIEFGSRHQAARPFLRPAFDESGPEMIAAITDQLGADIAALARAEFKTFRIG